MTDNITDEWLNGDRLYFPDKTRQKKDRNKSFIIYNLMIVYMMVV